MNETEQGQQPRKLLELFLQLRRRGFRLGIDDYLSLRDAVWAGFGLSSSDDLRDVCCSLWAKSPSEIEILSVLFERLALAAWDIFQRGEEQDTSQNTSLDTPASAQALEAPTTQEQGTLSPIVLDEAVLPKRSFVLVPLLPLTYREITQAWRRLRRVIYQGPSIEIDIEATIDQRSRFGVATPIVLKPRRHKVTRLLLLIDRQGSMAPFHRLSEELSNAIQRTGKLDRVVCYYYHNLPIEGANEDLLEAVADSFFPNLDNILTQIESTSEGYVYADTALRSSFLLEDVLCTYAADGAVAIVSDAGAARGDYNTLRLLDTIAFLKAVHTYTTDYVWLNPLPEQYWKQSTAEQIARHVPMFFLDRVGMNRAVTVLRGQSAAIERPL